jgi:hypothetical protein
MFPFFHVAIPLLSAEIYPKKNNWQISRFSLIIGSMLPDVLDKPFALMGLSSGRSMFHAPLLWLGFWLLLLIFQSKRAEINSVFIGVFFHFLLDLPSIPFFWPFVEYDWPITGDFLNYWIWALTHNPLVITTELIGIIIIGLLILKYKLVFDWKRIREFLFSPINSISS